MARSATPLSWWTCGGQVVLWTPAGARNSVDSEERNSDTGAVAVQGANRATRNVVRLFTRACKDAMKRRT
eukprot:2529734-Pleurochrysis_carterae.AAC.4